MPKALTKLVRRSQDEKTGADVVQAVEPGDDIVGWPDELMAQLAAAGAVAVIDDDEMLAATAAATTIDAKA